MKLVLATNNSDKIAEIRVLLGELPVTILTKADFPHFPDIPETALTLEGNAELKATGIRHATGIAALADDTGLEVDALDGAPGVFAARYAGENASYEDNCRKLLSELKGKPPSDRNARFRCVIALDWGDCVEKAEGMVEGIITDSLRGGSGFGYDPVFYYPPAGKTFAEMTLAEKNEISHRALALADARKLIMKRLEIVQKVYSEKKRPKS